MSISQQIYANECSGTEKSIIVYTISSKYYLHNPHITAIAENRNVTFSSPQSDTLKKKKTIQDDSQSYCTREKCVQI